MRKPTRFEEKVYRLISKIPKGKVLTYGQAAKILRSSPRAVGQALRRNPYAPKVPCHRVIMGDCTLGGYAGKLNSKNKIRLLKSEGIRFNKGIIDEKFVDIDKQYKSSRIQGKK